MHSLLSRLNFASFGKKSANYAKPPVLRPPRYDATMMQDLNPVPVTATANLSSLELERGHLNNLNPLDDPGAHALQTALLTSDVREILERLEALERSRS